MLTLFPQVMVTGVPGAFGPTDSHDYLLFPDSDDRNLFYALAERPTFAADGSANPDFNLTWYFGGGEAAGGICTMTVALPLPDLANPGVKEKFINALTTNPAVRQVAQSTFDLCVAMAAGDAAKTASLKSALGFTDDIANRKLAAWNKTLTWEQFLPDLHIDIRPMPFKGGTVTVQSFANATAYQEGQPEFSTGKLETTPSLVNSNAAVVTFNLQDLGANLFWHGLGGPSFNPGDAKPAGYDPSIGGSSVISVTYKVEFDGLLPEAKATVTCSHEVMAKLDIETKVRNGSWGSHYNEEVVTGKEYQDAVTNSTVIVLPSVASKEDKDGVQKLLTDWAAKQLEEMVAMQLPSVNLADLSLDGARKISTVSNQSRCYSLTQAVTVPKYPQAQLPKINGIVTPDALGKFFQVINLDDKPYFDVDLTMRPPNLSFLKQRQVERFVVTQILYGQENLRKDGVVVSTREYPTSEPQGPSETLKGTFDKNTKDRTLEYGILVAYTDGTPSYQVKSLTQDGNNNYLDLGGLDIGVLGVTLDGISLPWDVVSSAQVELRYGAWKKTVLLKEGDAPQLVVQPFGVAMGPSLSYQMTLNLTAGAPVVGDAIEVPLVRGNATIQLANPLGDRICAIRFDMDKDLSAAQLRAEYTLNDGKSTRIFNKLIELNTASADADSLVWRVPNFSSVNSSFRITKARVTVAGAVSDLKDLSGGVVAPLLDETDITVKKDALSAF